MGATLRARVGALPVLRNVRSMRDRLRLRRIEAAGDPVARSRARWRSVEPDARLTWHRELSGDAFISQVAATGAFGPDKAVLEVGPGYGRLLAACLDRDVPFARYVGV